LLVKGEIGDIDGAGRLVDGRGYPQYVPVTVDDDIGLVRHFVLAVGAKNNNNDICRPNALRLNLGLNLNSASEYVL